MDEREYLIEVKRLKDTAFFNHLVRTLKEDAVQSLLNSNVDADVLFYKRFHKELDGLDIVIRNEITRAINNGRL